MCEAHQTEGAEAKPERASIDATKIIFYNLKRRTLLSNFKGRFSRFKWYIGTYHCYKKISAKLKARLSKLSFITDKLRKAYGKKAIIYMTKEFCEDRTPHYHFLVGLEKDDWGCSVELQKIRNTKLWYREWKLGENFTFHDEDDYGNKVVPFYVRTDLKVLDMGARQRWFNYGIHQYLLYITKYSNFKMYQDIFIQN